MAASRITAGARNPTATHRVSPGGRLWLFSAGLDRRPAGTESRGGGTVAAGPAATPLPADPAMAGTFSWSLSPRSSIRCSQGPLDRGRSARLGRVGSELRLPPRHIPGAEEVLQVEPFALPGGAPECGRGLVGHV